jgi:hypothetical protein
MRRGPESFWQYDQPTLEEVTQELLDDVGYAYRRWKIRLYYMDSNGGPAEKDGQMYHAKDAIEPLLKAYPDILLAPEAETTNYYQWCSAFDSYLGSATHVSTGVRMSYPGSFNVVSVDQFKDLNDYLPWARLGDIYMINVWFSWNATDSLAKIVQLMGKRPVAAITSPVDGATVPGNFTITATASDSDGTISRVEFLSAGIVLGSDNTAPYSFAWPPGLIKGRHQITARAIDNNGVAGCSRSIVVNVGGSSAVIDKSARPAGMSRAGAAGAPVPVYGIGGRKILQFTAGGGERGAMSRMAERMPPGVYITAAKHGGARSGRFMVISR